MRQIVLIPVYNEEEHLQGLLGRLREIYDGDVLFVDDGSIDCSPQLLRELESTNTVLLCSLKTVDMELPCYVDSLK